MCPPLRGGRRRVYIVYSDGFVIRKELTINPKIVALAGSSPTICRTTLTIILSANKAPSTRIAGKKSSFIFFSLIDLYLYNTMGYLKYQ